MADHHPKHRPADSPSAGQQLLNELLDTRGKLRASAARLAEVRGNIAAQEPPVGNANAGTREANEQNFLGGLRLLSEELKHVADDIRLQRHNRSKVAMLDIFNNDAFSIASMTAKVNKIPFVPGQVGASGVFDEQGVTTRLIAIEESNGTLSLVAPSPRGGPGETTDNDKRKIRAFEVPHFQRDDAVMADEVQGVRGFGSDINNPDQALQTIEAVVEQKSRRHTNALDATLEHQRVGAIKGLVTDKNGRTMFDLYNLYGLSAPTPVEFHLDVATTDTRAICFDVIDAIETSLDNVGYTGVHAFVGNDFWKGLIGHKSVRETYLNTVQAAELRGSLHVYRFEYGGIVWERYRTGTQASASNSAGAFIGASEARFVATGVPELFITRFAPADYEETRLKTSIQATSAAMEQQGQRAQSLRSRLRGSFAPGGAGAIAAGLAGAAAAHQATHFARASLETYREFDNERADHARIWWRAEKGRHWRRRSWRGFSRAHGDHSIPDCRRTHRDARQWDELQELSDDARSHRRRPVCPGRCSALRGQSRCEDEAGPRSHFREQRIDFGSGQIQSGSGCAIAGELGW